MTMRTETWREVESRITQLQKDVERRLTAIEERLSPESAAEYVEGYEARNAAAWERGQETVPSFYDFVDEQNEQTGEPVVWEDGKDSVATFDDIIFERDEAREAARDWQNRALTVERKLRAVKAHIADIATFLDVEADDL